MLHYPYEFKLSPSTPSQYHRKLLGQSVSLLQANEFSGQAEWPLEPQSIVVARVPTDTLNNVDPSAQRWIDQASPGPKLEVLFRSVRIIWKSGRAYVQGPSDLTDCILNAILDYALLDQAVAQLEHQAFQLGLDLIKWQSAPESNGSIAPLRLQVALATNLSLRLIDLRPYCELPVRTGDASLEMRLRTEMLTQAQTSDALGLIEHRLEIILDGLVNQLQLSQDSRRSKWELIVGFCILVFVVLEAGSSWIR